jgi:hypothetical protein
MAWMENPTMKSLKMRLMLSAVGVALLATPALAQKPHHQTARQQEIQSQYNNRPDSYVGTYPNDGIRSGTAASHESGAEDNLLR